MRRYRCPNCGFPIEPEWNYCPNCGFILGIKKFDFQDIFEEIEKTFLKEFREMFKPESLYESLKKEFEELEEIKPKFSGISIEIRSQTGKKPQIKVKTFGEYKKLEPKIKEKLYKQFGVEEIEEAEEKKMPKVVEEPEVKTIREKNQIRYEILLPEIEKEENVSIKELEQSIEVRAVSKDKGYFKIIPIPPGKKLIGYSFEKGKLTLIFE